MTEHTRKYVQAISPLVFALLYAGCGGSSGSGSNANVAAGGSCHLSTQSLQAKLASAGAIMPLDESMTAGATMKTLQGHIPHAVKSFADQGKTSESQQLSVVVTLPLNNEDDLNNEIAQIYQSGSPKYHQFLSSDEFKSRYSPTQQQVEQVENYLQSQGITPNSVDVSNRLIRASGSVSAVNAMGHTEIHNYQDSSGKKYYAPAYEIQVPQNVPIQAVLGLQNVSKWHTHAIAHAPVTGSTTATPHGSGPSGGLSPSDIRTAYAIPSSANGSGQTLALLELDGYNASDITAYESQFGLAAVPLKNVLVDETSQSVGGGQGEVTLDIELMTALAPSAAAIMVYEGPNSDTGILDIYTKIANDNTAKEVSSSWGSAENGTSSSMLQAENTVFQQMAAQGQSMFAAAGDAGAYDSGGSTLTTDDPGSQPYVVSVGGTSLTVGTGGTYTSETTWNDGSGSAGGGGVSGTWSIPSWQAGLATAANKGSSTMRNTPDVSIEADPNNGYSIYVGGSWTIFGGTSCAAPLWAAFMAGINQQRISNGQGLLGYPNPSLYALGEGSRYGSDFHDIADGSTNLYYPAVTGYDNATGWGTPQGANLFSDLTSGSVSLPVASCGG